MSNNNKKAAKKKERERKSKAKVLKVREALRKSRKEVEEQERLDREAYYLKYGRPQPIIKDPAKAAERAAKKEESIKKRLERNLKILEALEAEYDAEQAGRQQTNESLEAQGHRTIKEKMDALHKKALGLTGKTQEYEQIVAETTQAEKIEEKN